MQSIQNLLVLRRHPSYTSIQVCRIFTDVVLSVVGGHCSSYLSLLQLKTSLGYIYATSAICGHLWKLKSAMKEALSCSSWLLCCVKYVHTLQTDGWCFSVHLYCVHCELWRTILLYHGFISV